MEYKSYRLNDMYTALLEQNTEDLTIGSLISQEPHNLVQYLKQLKAENPYNYGKLLVKLYTTPRGKVKLQEVFR